MAQRSTKKPGRSWADIVLDALRSKDEPVTLSYVYGYVEARVADLVGRNPKNWRAKVRQVLQRLRDQGLAAHVRSGVWDRTDGTAPVPEITLASD